MQSLDDLLEIMSRLRRDCPWDREQNLESLRSYLVEETYECLDAMDQAIAGTRQALYEELGDLLLQIVFQSQVLSEMDGGGAMDRIIRNLSEKLVRRHPHVFGNLHVENADEVKKNWEEIKQSEKSKLSTNRIDENIPRTFPSLVRALKLGRRAEKWKFDWEHHDQLWAKIREELRELEESTPGVSREDELGDVLFCLVQWARHQNLDPEVCLAKANEKFVKRFEQMKKESKSSDEDFMALSLEAKEALWQKAKQRLRER